MMHDDSQAGPPGLTSVARYVSAACPGVSASVLLLGHRAYNDGVLGDVPYLFLEARSLTQEFMDRGHRHHSPGVDWLAHDSGRLLDMVFGGHDNPQFEPFHRPSNLLIAAGFVVIVFSFLLQRPTLSTIVMFPIVLVACKLLARSEERDALAELGNEHRRYMDRTPRFIPRIGAGSAGKHMPTRS